MAATTKKPNREAVVEALMTLAAERPWDDIELGDIAEAAGLTLAELREMFPSKGAILGGFARMIDVKVLEGSGDDLLGEPARERLFDVYMRTIDALTPYKSALRRIAYAVRGEPLTLAALNQVALNSHRYLLAAAGIPTEDALGPIKVQGSVITLARTLETWFEDDDPQLARTMARLDKELGRAESFMARAEDVRRITAPFRAIGQAILDGGARMRRGDRFRDRRDDDRDDGADGETQDPAAAI